MRAAVWVVALVAGCGRNSFDPLRDAAGVALRDALGDASPDADPLTVARVAQFGFENTFSDATGTMTATCVAGQCPTFIAGKHGQGVHFDGVAQCLQFDASTMSGPSFTVALWANQATDGRYAIISKPFDAAASDNDSWQIETDTTDTFGFSTANAGRHDYMWLYSAVTPGLWQHVAITWDGTLKRIYVNGSLAESLADADLVQFDATPPLIGCDLGFAATGYFYPGVIDDVVVYNRALSDAEIAQLANLAQ